MELTTLSRILLEKLTVAQLVKRFPVFYGTQRFITVFTKVRHRSLSSASWIQSTNYFPQIHTQLRITQFSTASCRFISLRPTPFKTWMGEEINGKSLKGREK
jgi:hypothetical protein